ncbi:MFS transporter [Pseudomonas sp. 10B1]|uniref:MFS transporter n=1 Tax=unclassified Pseudomonas TaxID=196821 RepID=UPI002B225719|nr:MULTISPECIES: MFS transporter [unclassified Pseudomonas]MEA9997078.1 MFS transporter [Pseudomonas sp. AA4]MEB0087724.1 MFS transporter [Pseudomonas sp. RTI1]MEB0124846.1 MFS transporter [Pseudomonas sp. CCC1.2]MEB0155741.1 MFS transporter [Pseudomonas sp. CCC4.3]MEB0217781.1 MFS transporter [Pseudomonas sp. AB12(2023)]
MTERASSNLADSQHTHATANGPRPHLRPRSWFRELGGPFAYRAFTTIWVASLFANIGGAIQNVGAFWLMTSMAPTPAQVSLVQTASTLPIALFALLSGVAADAWDRRLVMLTSQLLVCSVAVMLAVLCAAGQMSPLALLFCTFLSGCGTAMFQPAWQSAVAEQVPGSELSAAIALDSFSLNFARTAGPAVGGLIVAQLAPGVAFIVSGVSSAGLIYVLLRWRRRDADVGALRVARQGLLGSLVGGIRYCFCSHGIRSALLRSGLFGFLGSPVWALLPLFAKQQFGGEARTYGILLGAFGAGAACGALGGAAMRARHHPEWVLRLCTLAFGLGALMTAWSPSQGVAMLGLAISGASWVIVVSTYNLAIQTASPGRVAGRALSLFHSCMVAGLAIGSFVWGMVATATTINATFVISGLFMCASMLLALRMPLPSPIPSDQHLKIAR